MLLLGTIAAVACGATNSGDSGGPTSDSTADASALGPDGSGDANPGAPASDAQRSDTQSSDAQGGDGGAINGPDEGVAARRDASVVSVDAGLKVGDAARDAARDALVGTDGQVVDGAGGDSALGTFFDAGTLCYSGQTHTDNLNNNNWAGSLTLFISYSADTRSQTVDEGFTSAQWNAAVNSFDVPGFVAQVANTGAKNVLLMLGQNTGYYCSPNSTYEGYAGVLPNTRCSSRDLPLELADALSARGIGLFLYLPEDVGWGDTVAAQHFGLSAMAVSNWVVDATFTPKWNAVIKTWADRYGSRIRGWFFDGYEIRWGVTAAMAQTYQDTCRSANPCAVVTFNGTGSNSVSDTERGETAINTATGLPAKGLPTSRWTSSGLQTMWDFPLQAAWGQEIADNSPAIYTNANLKTFITAATKAQAVFALDVRTSLAGALSTPIYNQLLAIKP